MPPYDPDVDRIWQEIRGSDRAEDVAAEIYDLAGALSFSRPAWRHIGGEGEPPFQNQWGNRPTDRGRGETLFTLPEGYRAVFDKTPLEDLRPGVALLSDEVIAKAFRVPYWFLRGEKPAWWRRPIWRLRAFWWRFT